MRHCDRSSRAAHSLVKIWSWKYFSSHSSSFPDSRRAVCQLMAKECALSTGNLPLGSLPRNSVVRITDHRDMTLAVDWDVEHQLDQPIEFVGLHEQDKFHAYEKSCITLGSETWFIGIVYRTRGWQFFACMVYNWLCWYCTVKRKHEDQINMSGHLQKKIFPFTPP